MKMFKKENAFDLLLQEATLQKKKRLLFLWNRGLGDIPLGLYALCVRVRQFIPDAEITFLTRPDLADCFCMIEKVNILAVPSLKRGEVRKIGDLLAEVGASSDDFDLVIEKADPTRWLAWQIGNLIPKLAWQQEWDAYANRFEVPQGCIAVHIQSETKQYYGYQKDWPFDSWLSLIRAMPDQTFMLFGFDPHPPILEPHVIDLRGKTSLFEMLSLIKNRARTLIAPDSGVLSLLYYVDADFPIDVISLWSDPRQGVLRQKVPSPNSLLKHFPLIGKKEKVSNISVERVKMVVQHECDRLCSASR